MLLDLSMQQCTDTLKSVVYLVFGIKKKKIDEELLSLLCSADSGLGCVWYASSKAVQWKMLFLMGK